MMRSKKEACFSVLEEKSVIKIEAYLPEKYGKTHCSAGRREARLFAMVACIRVGLDRF
jgi:hypothetical protein